MTETDGLMLEEIRRHLLSANRLIAHYRVDAGHWSGIVDDLRSDAKSDSTYP